MWMPERVWEQSLTADLAEAGIKYTVLDDFHFKNAGLTDEQLHGYYLTEDDGRLLSIFPGSEPLRYTIPFQQPQATIDYLRGIAEQQPGAVVVFGDDGEKFGVWPETKKHVYEHGWLRQFFDALPANRDWLHADHAGRSDRERAAGGQDLSARLRLSRNDRVGAAGRQQIEYDHLVHELEHDPRWPRIKRFVQGGFWRNFKVKYPEANEMYARMMMASRRLATGGAGRPAEPTTLRLRPAGAVSRAVQLPLLARRVRRHLSAALAQRGLQPADRLRQPARPGDGQDRRLRRGDRRRLQLRRPAGSPPGQRPADLPARAGGGRHAVRAGRALDLPQPAGHARPPARGVSPQGAGRRRAAATARSPAFTTAWSSSRPASTSGCNTTAAPRKSLLDHFYDPGATLRGRQPRRSDRAGRLRPGRSTNRKSAAAPTACRCSSRGWAAWRAARCGSPRASRSTAGSPTLEIAYLLENLPADLAAALCGRAQFRRPALRRRRPLLPRRPAATAWASSAGSST